jgi:hypothetical protein
LKRNPQRKSRHARPNPIPFCKLSKSKEDISDASGVPTEGPVQIRKDPNGFTDCCFLHVFYSIKCFLITINQGNAHFSQFDNIIMSFT